MGVWARGAEAAAGAVAAGLLLLVLLLLRRRLSARAPKTPPHALLDHPPLIHIYIAPTRTAVLASPPSPRAGAREHDGVQQGPPLRLPLPEQWLLHKRPPDCQYATAIARPLAHMLAGEPDGAETSHHLAALTPRHAYSVTRSPSLEKDDKSPFVGKEAPEECEDRVEDVFNFDPSTTDPAPALRRYRSVSTRLDVCGAAAMAGESPRYFTPPENISPAFFNEPSPKSVYYDTVRSPRFFADTPTPRTAPLPEAPPPRRSPKVHASNKENYFTFDAAVAGATPPRPRRYGGRHSMDRERYTPPADREPRAYRRHNSADTDIAEHRLVLVETIPRTGKESPDTDSTLIRRQRLKSASLDSEHPRVIEHIPVPPLTAPPYHKHMKEQLNQARAAHYASNSPRSPHSPRSPRSPDLHKKSLRGAVDAHSFVDAPRFSPKELEITVTSEEGATRRETPPDHRDEELGVGKRGRNPRNLTIDLSRRDADLERELREFERLYSDAGARPRTPTLKVKATSLDSSDSVTPMPTARAPTATASVPNTPKRQPRRLLLAPRRADAPPPLLGVHYKQNLSVSSTNLKTLPEGVPSDDFEPGTDDGSQLPRRDSHHVLLPAGPVTSPHASSVSLGEPSTLTTSRNCLLQRRGSNHSLTLSIGTAAPIPGDLSRHPSNASLPGGPRRGGLLERRASNTSLTLSVGLAQPTLACSVSQHELSAAANVSSRGRGGLLERRASNTSLTLSLAAEAEEPRHLHALPPPNHHRKALSSEDLVTRAPIPTPGYGSHGSLARHTPLTLMTGDRDELIYAVGAPGDIEAAVATGPTVIGTRPLSPQTTSEEFRQYLANMQHLQTASSVLTRRQLRDLHELFQHGYANATMPEPAPLASPDAGDTASRQKALLRTLHREFWDMPNNLQEKPLVAGSHAKNRYRSILPNEHSRVRLRDDTDEDEDDGNKAALQPPLHPADRPESPDLYINANYIKGGEDGGTWYIATQGPLANTIYEFWLMVQQQWMAWSARHPTSPAVPQRVVMLTELVEGGRAKCECYFPLITGEAVTYASERNPRRTFTVTALSIVDCGGYTVRRLELKHSRRRRVVPVFHYWFRDWADHRCPGDAAALLRLALDLEPDAEPTSPPGPPAIVHCSAGVGRTGCLLAVLAGLRQLRRDRRVDVLAIVCGLRLDRGGMLQTSEQYELVHRVLARYERDHLPPD